MSGIGPLKRALSHMRRDIWLQWVAISSLAVTLAIVGAYLSLCLNLQHALSGMAAGGTAKAVLKENTPPAKAARLAQELKARPEVASVEYVSAEEGLKRFAVQLGPHKDLLEGVRENPLPAVLQITLTPDSPMPNLRAFLLGSGLVSEVITGRPWLSRLDTLTKVFHELAVAFGLLLFLGVVLLVSNITRLMVHVRRNELEVMELVGASSGYIRRPFLIESLLQSLGAAVLATSLIWLIFQVLAAPATLPLGLNLSGILAFRFGEVLMILALVAAAAAMLGCFLGVGRARSRKRP